MTASEVSDKKGFTYYTSSLTWVRRLCWEIGQPMCVNVYAFHRTGRRAAALAVTGIFIFTSGCDTGREANFDRSDRFTELGAQVDRSAPSDLTGSVGHATYTGAAVANFGDFGGTADVKLNADLGAQTMNGSMTSWSDLDPSSYVLRGQVALSNGSITDDGRFTSVMSGNIERNPRGLDDPDNPVVLMVFQGSAAGQIYDSIGGAEASLVDGTFVGTSFDGGGVNGRFIAGR